MKQYITPSLSVTMLHAEDALLNVSKINGETSGDGFELNTREEETSTPSWHSTLDNEW